MEIGELGEGRMTVQLVRPAVDKKAVIVECAGFSRLFDGAVLLPIKEHGNKTHTSDCKVCFFICQ